MLYRNQWSQLDDDLHTTISYAYDLGIGDSKAMEGGVHEVMLQFMLGKKW